MIKYFTESSKIPLLCQRMRMMEQRKKQMAAVARTNIAAPRPSSAFIITVTVAAATNPTKQKPEK